MRIDRGLGKGLLADLRDVGAVEAIDAVGAQHAALLQIPAPHREEEGRSALGERGLTGAEGVQTYPRSRALATWSGCSKSRRSR